MSSIEIFIAVLKEKKVVSEQVLSGLKKIVAQKQAEGAELTPKSLAALLVHRSLATEDQVKDILHLTQQRQQADAKPKPKNKEEEMLLTLLDDDDPPPKKSAAPPEKKPGDPKKETPKKEAAKKPAAPTASSLLEEEMGLDVGSGGLSGLDDAALATADPLTGGPPAAGKKKKGLLGKLTDVAIPEEKAEKKRKKLEKKLAKENPWDSKLILLGGGALLLIIILGVALTFALTWQSADDLFKLAEEDYGRASYTQAIEKYDKFIAGYPNHIMFSKAKVHRGMAKMRQSLDNASSAAQFSKALADMKSTLEEIKYESAFNEANGELAAILPRISEGLAKAATQTLSPEVTAEAKEAVNLTEKYAARENASPRMNEVRAHIATAEWNTLRDNELKKVETAILEKLSAGDTAAAYALRFQLLKDYPDLAEDLRLLRVTLQVAEKERDNIRFVEENVAAEPASAHVSDAAFSGTNLVLVQPASVTKDVKTGTAGVTRLVAAPDAVYAINCLNGEVFWRYSLSGNFNTRTPPHLPVWLRDPARGGKSGNDRGLLLVDSKNQTLNFIADRTLRWTQPVGEKIDANVVATANEAMLSSTAGKLYVFQAEDGVRKGHYLFQQPLCTAPVWSAEKDIVYQVAEHSNMFALANSQRDAKACVRVYHVGHGVRKVLMPPVLAGEFVLVLVDNGKQTLVKVYPQAEAGKHYPLLESGTAGAGDEDKTDGVSDDASDDASLLAAIAPIQEFTLTGAVDMPPLVLDERVLIVSDTGEMQVWNITAANQHQPFQMVASGTSFDTRQGARETSVVSYFPLLNAREVYVAGSQLERFDIQATTNRLSQKWVINQDSVTLQPLEWIANAKTLMHVRRVKNRTGIDVRAVETENGNTHWDIQLAVPLVSEPTVLADGRVLLSTRSGAVFDATAEVRSLTQASAPAGTDTVLQKIMVQAPAEHVVQQVAQSFCDEKGGFVLVPAGDTSQLLIYRPGGKAFDSKFVPDEISGNVLPYKTAMLVPGKKGQIYLMSRDEGTMKATPFQAKLKGDDFVWQIMQLGDAQQWLAADNYAHLYRFTLKKEEGKRLPAFVTEASVKLEEPVVGRLAILDNTVCFVDAAKDLWAFTSTDTELKPVKLATLEKKVVAGPWTVGGMFVAVNEIGEMLAWDTAGKELWKQALPTDERNGFTQLSGPPILHSGKILAATVDGSFFSTDPVTGQRLSSARFQWGFATGPVVCGSHYLVGTLNGCLTIVAESDSVPKDSVPARSAAADSTPDDAIPEE